MKQYSRFFGAVCVVSAMGLYQLPAIAATVNLSPSISGTPVNTVAAGSPYAFAPSATDPDVGDVLTFSITGKPTWASFDTTTGVLSGTPIGINAKTYTGIVISVRDSKFNKVSLPAFSLIVTNDAPVLEGTPATTAYTGQRYRFEPTASDANDDKLKFTISRQPAWATFSTATGVLTGIPTDAQVGNYNNIVITATDGNKKTSLSPFSIAISNPAPTISGVPASSVKSGRTYRFLPDASDLNKPAGGLSFSISNKPDWATFDPTTGRLEGVAVSDRTVTTDKIAISVSDGVNTARLPAFGITVVAGATYAGCSPEVSGGTAFSCQLPVSAGTSFALNNPAQGMAIQPKTGILHWTPTSNQTGQHYVGVTLSNAQGSQQLTVPLNVVSGAPDPDGIYVATDGDDTAAGTASAPFKSISRAADSALKGQTIHVRGGVYFNAEYDTPFDENRRYGALARITTSGTAANPITLRPYGNEYVKLVSDVTALQFTKAQHWVVEGLELEGTTQNFKKEDVIALWWVDGAAKISGRGISTNESQNITLRHNIIHDFPGAGVGNNGSDMIKVENNVIYNNGWWSPGGVHGVANSYLTTAPGNEGKEGLVMTGNLVFGNQSRVISHVFSKGNVDLAIDEGNGLHAQNNASPPTFKGNARIENNVLLFNGKAGFGINTMGLNTGNEVKVKNNAFYQNAQIVNTGELAIQSATGTIVNGNLFHPRTDRRTLKDSADNYSLLRGNASTYGVDSAQITEPNVLQSVVFNAPESGDFSPLLGIAGGVGVEHLQRMAAVTQEYGIKVQAPAGETVDNAYLCWMKQAIFDSWEAADAALKTITLTDRDDGSREYRYEDRGSFSCTP